MSNVSRLGRLPKLVGDPGRKLRSTDSCNLKFGRLRGSLGTSPNLPGRVQGLSSYLSIPCLDFVLDRCPSSQYLSHTTSLYQAESASVSAGRIRRMSSDIETFAAHLQSSKRILALIGAGLSASSGLPTFRGAGGLWRTHDATSLATPEAFSRDPGLVWQFYSYRRHMALKAQPNRAHLVLAELARKHPGFLALSQNVDGTHYFVRLLFSN